MAREAAAPGASRWAPAETCGSPAATGTSHSRSLTPDDDVFQHLAHVYASRNPTMKKGDQCKDKMDFPNGITNGYAWYPLRGGSPPPPGSSALGIGGQVREGTGTPAQGSQGRGWGGMFP